MNKSNIAHLKTNSSMQFAEFALQHASDCIYWIMPDASFFYVNNAACEILGYTRDELLTMSIFDIDPLVSRKLWREQWQKIKTDKYLHVESQHRTKDGRLIDIDIKANYLEFEGEEYNCAIVRDITERRQIEEALRLESEMLANMTEGILLVRASDGMIVHTNPQFEKLFGYGPGALTGKHVSILNAPTDKSPEETATEILGVLNEKGAWAGEIKNIRKDGTVFWTQVNITKFEHSSYGTVWLTSQQDITERKESEQKLKDSEEKYRTLVEHSPYCIHEIDRNGKIISMNRAGLQMSGMERETEIIGVEYLCAVAEADRPRIKQLLDDAINGNASEFEFTSSNGKYYQSSFVPIVLNAGFVQRIMGITVDITGRKQAEETLGNTVSLLHATMESTADGILVVDRAGRIVNFNQHFVELWKIPAAVIDTRDDNLALAFVMDQLQDPEQFLKNVRELYSQPETETFDLLEFRDGRVFERFSQPQCIDDQVVGRVWSFRDITQRRKDEAALRYSEARFRTAMQFSPIGMALVAPDGRWLAVNHALCQIVGYTQDEMRNLDFQSITHPDDLHADLEYMRAMLNREIVTYQMEKRYVHKAGHNIWVLLSVSLIRSNDGTPHYFISQIQDITSRKDTEEKLNKAQNMLHSVLDTIPARVFWKDTESRFLGCNTHFARDGGLHAPEELIGKDDYALPWAAQAEIYRADDREIMRQGKAKLNYEEPQTRPDGSNGWLRTNKIPLQDKDGNIIGILGTYEDITESKKMEQALKESEEKFYKAFNSSPDSMVINRLSDGRLINVNEAFEKIVGYSRAEAVGKTPIELDIWTHPEERERYLSTLKQGNCVRDLEVSIRKKDGTIRIHKLSAETFTLNGEDCIVSVGRDITDHKIEQQQLKRSLRALRVLSSCNGAVTRISDEQQLLESVCSIAVQEGNYRFAWVGYPQNDAVKTVLPIVHAGHEAGYLKNLITWAEDNKRGQGPTGTCIRTKSNVVVRNIANDPIFQPWREPALLRGFASSVALALVAGTEVIGALMIYASDVDAFDEDEVKLLAELADNLAKGVHNLRIERSLESTRQAADRQYRERRLLDRALAAAIDPIIISDANRDDNPIIYCNAAFERLTGYTTEEVIGKNPRFLQKNDTYQPALKGVRKALQLGKKASVVLRNYKKDGTLFWNELHLAPVKDDNNKITHWIGVHNDITRQKLAEIALTESEDKFSKAFRSLSDPLTISRLVDGTIVDVNDSCCVVSGYGRDELIGKNVFAVGVGAWADPEQQTTVTNNLLNYGNIANVEADFIKKNGETAHTLISADIIQIGNVLHMLLLAKDITLQKKAQEALQQNERRLRFLYEENPSMYFTIALDGSMKAVNTFGAKILGYTVEELIGKPVFILFAQDDHGTVQEQLNDCMTHPGSTSEWEIRKICKDGRLIWVKETAVAVASPEGEMVILIVCRDISDRKQADEKLLKTQLMLTAAQRVARLGSWELNFSDDHLTWSDEVFHIFEIDKSKFGASYETFLASVHPDDRILVDKVYRDSLKNKSVYDIVHRLLMPDGRIKYVNEKCETQYDKEGKPLRSLGTVLDVTNSILIQKELEERANQQNFIAELGKLAIAETELDIIFTTAVTGLASILGVEYTKILQLEPDGESLLLRSSVGWHKDLVGKARVSAGHDSQAGYTLLQKDAVIVKDLRKETRFKGPPLLTDHNVISGVSVIIAGTGKPFGVLGIHTRSYREFSQNAIDFVQSIAYVLSESINRAHVRNIILKSREKLRSLTQRLQNIREEERMKISREIHDDLGQRLTALKMDLSWISRHLPKDSGNLPEKLNAVISLTDSTLDVTHKIALELRPAILDDLGLLSAIEWEARRFSERANCSYTLDLEDATQNLDRDQTITIFRILQEALTNIIRHAHASHVVISLNSDDEKSQLIVSDNGVGMRADHLSDMDSLGIMSMRERAGALGGRVTLKNGENGGTIVTLDLPVNKFRP